MQCHEGPYSGGLQLGTYEQLMAGGNSGNVVSPGNHENSLIWQYLSDGTMPQNNPDLEESLITLIATWIDEGALYEEDSNLTDACDLPINNIYLDGGDVWYNVDFDIGGFQWNVDGATVSGASGGDAAAAGFTVSAGGSTVLGFSFTGGVISAGCGTLTQMTLNGSATGLSGIVFSDPVGASVDVDYYDDSGDGGDDGGCDDLDNDGICDDVDDCVGSYDDCGTCNGNNADMDCAGECGGSAMIDECGVCNGDGSTCDDLLQLSISNAAIDALETASLEVSLTNEQTVGGFQFQVIDIPNQGMFTDVQVTDRTALFTVSFNEQPDGSVIIVGFDLTGAGLSAGEGSILTLSYESTSIYSSEISISLDLNQSIISDPVGMPLEYVFVGGTVTVDGEDPPPVSAPENLTAVGGFGEISLSWDDTNVVEIIGYHVFREGSLIGTATSTNYTETGLQQATEYCYTVTAFSDNNESGESNIACGTTTEIYLEEPQNLTAEENGLEVYLDWETPPSGIGIGDDCVTDYGDAGFIDCIGFCFSATLLGWVGDGFCDDGTYGVVLTCPEWECDGCDCAGTGTNSEECIEECGSFSNNGNQGTASKQIAEGTLFVGLRDLIGYEIYRDNEFVDYTEETEYLDTSDGLWYLEESCYNVTSVWDEGTSGYSNTACVTPQLNSPGSLSAQGTGSFITLEWTSTPDNDQTSFNIYRDDALLTTTTDLIYEDNETDIGQEYCYFVKAYYDGIGESPATNTSCSTWNVYPPSQIEAVPADQLVTLTWEEPVGGEEYHLQYDDGVLQNAFYFFGTYEDGLAHGTKFDVGVDFDILAASLKILSEGDEYWPWPNDTHGPVRVLIFDDNNGVPGNLIYESEAVAEDGLGYCIS